MSAQVPDELLAVLQPEALLRYTDLQLLGHGGRGRVYLAHDRKLKRTVALKIVSPDLRSCPREQTRFRRETVAISRISHPNVIRLLDVPDERLFSYYTMEFIEGSASLSFHLRRRTFDHRTIVELVRQAAAGVAAAHEVGYFHRDLKPSNLLVTPEPSVKVIDFGSARAQEHLQQTALTGDGMLVGTLLFQPPEAFEGLPWDERSDVYQLGLVLYEALVGAHPFEAATTRDMASGAALARVAPPSRCGGPDDPRLDAIVMRTLSAAPSARHRTAGLLRDDLAAWLARPSAPAQAPTEEPPVDTLAVAPSHRTLQRSTTSPLLRAAPLWALALAAVAVSVSVTRGILDVPAPPAAPLAAPPTRPRAAPRPLPSGPAPSPRFAALAAQAGRQYAEDRLEALAGSLAELKDLAAVRAERDLAAALRAGLAALSQQPRTALAAALEVEVPARLDLPPRGDLFQRLNILRVASTARGLPTRDFQRAMATFLALAAAPQDRPAVAAAVIEQSMAPFASTTLPPGGELDRVANVFVAVLDDRLESATSRCAAAMGSYHRLLEIADQAFVDYLALPDARAGALLPLPRALLGHAWTAWRHEIFALPLQQAAARWRRALAASPLAGEDGATLFNELAFAELCAAHLLGNEAPPDRAMLADYPARLRGTTAARDLAFLEGLHAVTTMAAALAKPGPTPASALAAGARAVRALLTHRAAGGAAGPFRDEAALALGRALCGLAACSDEPTWRYLARGGVTARGVLGADAPGLAEGLALLDGLAGAAATERVRRRARLEQLRWELRTRGGEPMARQRLRDLVAAERRQAVLGWEVLHLADLVRP